MNWIIQLDHILFRFINQTCSNPLLDTVMPVLTDLNKYWQSYALFGLLLLFWLYSKKRMAVLCLLQLVIALSLSDAIAYRIIKPSVQRERPEFVLKDVQLRTTSHSGFSFPSNHAANNFAAATILSFDLIPLTPVFFALASIIAISRVYVGVHFPFDVLGGAILGILCALPVTFLFQRFKIKQ